VVYLEQAITWLLAGGILKRKNVTKKCREGQQPNGKYYSGSCHISQMRSFL
jgi:hypothetical protein